MSSDKKDTGTRGEELACGYLRERGHFILERNWRISHLETDIISMNGEGIHFVEVKTRTAPAQADPEVNVDQRKRSRMVRAAGRYVNGCAIPQARDAELFFDVITVVLETDGGFSIEYYPQAFIPTYV